MCAVTIAEMVVLALRGDFVPFAVNVAATEASEVVRPYLPLAERNEPLGQSSRSDFFGRQGRDAAQDERVRLRRLQAQGEKFNVPAAA